MIIVMVMVIILIIYTAYFPYRYDQMRFTLDEVRERNIKMPLTLPYLLFKEVFGPGFSLRMIYPFKAVKLGPTSLL